MSLPPFTPTASTLTKQPSPARLDLYAPIHKALRAWMFDTLVSLGRVDGQDQEAMAAALGKVEALLVMCGQHLQHENDFMHPALARAGRHAAAQASSDHEGHVREIAHLQASVRKVRDVQGQAFTPALMSLYQALALFVAENLQHMHMEETAHNEALWATHTDAELNDLHDRLVQSIPPEEMVGVLRWMLPSISHAERVGMLQDMRGKMPHQVFEGVLQLAREVLPIHDWAALCRTLGIQVYLP